MRRYTDIREGEVLPESSWTVTRDDIMAFGEFLYPPTAENPARKGNPHIDEEYAKQSIFGGLFVDGNQTVAFLCRMATDWLPPGALVTGPSEVEFRFPNPVRVADVITFGGRVAGREPRGGREWLKLEMRACNQNGKVVAAGTIAVPMA